MSMTPSFRSEECQGFLNHWLSLRADGEMVTAQSVFLDNPHPSYAPFLHIADMMEDHLVFRLMGTQLVERWGRDKTGEMVGQDQPPVLRDALFKNGRQCAISLCGVRMEIEFASVNGAEMSIECIVLPLSLGPDKPMRLLSYSTVLRQLKHGDHSDHYLGLPVAEWIDIGAGVPEVETWVVSKSHK